MLVGVGGLALCALMIVSCWKLFEKAGEPGWACLVPIYNIFVMCRIAGTSPMIILAMFIPFINILAVLYLWAQIAKKFGKPEIWSLGLVFLSPIFIPMLAFGAEFIGNRSGWGDDGPGISRY